MADLSKKAARRALAEQVRADREALAQGQGAAAPAPRTDLRSGGSIIVTPASNDAAIQARQAEVARAQVQAAAGQADPGSFMVRPHAIAGFELAEIFAEWMRRADAGEDLAHGPPWPTDQEEDDSKQFGDRIARGILALLKEV